MKILIITFITLNMYPKLQFIKRMNKAPFKFCTPFSFRSISKNINPRKMAVVLKIL
jgi:hypothetical protein